MDNRDVIAIGGSAGSVEVVRRLARDLPADLPASVLVVIHQGAHGPGLLADVLNAEGALPAIRASDGQRMRRGCIYVAGPDRHLLVADGHLHLRRGPRENRTRPAIDPLFRSVAVCCSTRVIAVVLSGMLNDGTAGLAVRRCGGLTVVQDLRDAQCSDMPTSALHHMAVDHVTPASELGPLLARLAASPRPPPISAPEQIRLETMIAAQELTVMPDHKLFGALSPLTCPECNGSMQEIVDNELVRYRCHTGHAFTPKSLGAAHNEVWERTLYGAMRAQQEQAMLARRMAVVARARDESTAAATLDARARDYEEGAEVIRQMLASGGHEPDPSELATTA